MRARDGYRTRRGAAVAVAVAVVLSVVGVAGAPPASAAVCPPAVVAPFPDVPLNHPFCREIKTAQDHSVAHGYDDGTFRPGAVVTRQAAAAMLWRATNVLQVPVPCAAAPFPDVPASHPFCAEIRDAATVGVFDGYADGTFRPGDPISRQALAAVLTRYPDGPIPLLVCDDPPFPDVPVANPFCHHIRFLAEQGIVDGYDDGTYRPAAPVTRQAFVALLVRWITFLDGP